MSSSSSPPGMAVKNVGMQHCLVHSIGTVRRTHTHARARVCTPGTKKTKPEQEKRLRNMWIPCPGTSRQISNKQQMTAAQGKPPSTQVNDDTSEYRE